MISRPSKKITEPESDSDWDSLPGDVPEPSSSPEHKATTALSHSPVPPKQPHTHTSGKHHVTTKPMNMYNKTSLNNSQRNVTTFEDRSRGLWDDDDDEGNNNHSGGKSPRSKAHRVPESSMSKEKKAKQSAMQDQDKKRPPFTDFKDALKSPVLSSPDKGGGHELSAVNQAYRVDTGEGVTTSNHDSWDDTGSSQPSPNLKAHSKPHEKMGKGFAINDPEPTHQPSMKAAGGHFHHDDRHPLASAGLAPVHHLQRLDNSLHFENCCLVQVSQGPFDDRYRPSFFHGSKNHFHIREDDPKPAISDIADKSEVLFRRFWREVFGVLQILINFFAIFVLELLKVLVHSLRHFISGILYTAGDHFTKPLLAAFFNNVIQPFSILFLNLFTIMRNLLKPLLELTREIFSQISIPLRAFRLFELNWGRQIKHADSFTDIKVI